MSRGFHWLVVNAACDTIASATGPSTEINMPSRAPFVREKTRKENALRTCVSQSQQRALMLCGGLWLTGSDAARALGQAS